MTVTFERQRQESEIIQARYMEPNVVYEGVTQEDHRYIRLQDGGLGEGEDIVLYIIEDNPPQVFTLVDAMRFLVRRSDDAITFRNER